MGTSEPLVSVIVPVRNDSAGIRELLRRLAEQTVAQDQFEVVIGDDGSRPGELAGIATADGRVSVVSRPPRTSYAARNRAAARGRGRLLAFCDSDCLPEPTWLEQGLRAIEGADVVAGEVTFVAPDRPTAWSLLTIDMFLDQERNARFARAVTANMFVRRELFDAVGGFDESLPSGGDYDFARRSVESGRRLVYAPDAVVCHPTIDRRRPFLRKVWNTNRWAALRRARARRPPELASILTLVPVLGVLIIRRRVLRPMWGLHGGRLAAAGLRPDRWQHLRAMAVLHFVVSYVAALGWIRGWLEGCRHRRRNRAAAVATRGHSQSRTDPKPRLLAVAINDEP